MRKLATFILLLNILALPFSNSMYMFSIEEETTRFESYCLNHYLNSSSTNFSNSTRESNKFTISNRNLSHSHVILQYSLNNEDNAISSIVDKVSTSLHHLSKSWYFSSASNSSLYHVSQNLSPPLISSLPQQNSVLLI